AAAAPPAVAFGPGAPVAPFAAQAAGSRFAGPTGPVVAANPFALAAIPFAAATDPYAYGPFQRGVDEVPANAPEGSYAYTLVKSGPDVRPDEVETMAASVEVMILWDQMVLHVSHLTPPRSFYVGEEENKSVRCDYFIPSEKIGATRAPIVLADRGSVNVVLL